MNNWVFTFATEFRQNNARVPSFQVRALDKHQNQSALFCLNYRAKSKNAVINLIHKQHKRTF